MSDEPFYAPNYKSPTPRERPPSEPIFSFRLPDERHVDCVLRNFEPWGIEAQFFVDRKFSRSRRFPTRELALQWAERERAAMIKASPEDV